MYLCQFGQNLAIGSEDMVLTRLFHSQMTLATLKIRSRSPNLFIPLDPPNNISVSVWSDWPLVQKIEC